jgi:hypothetical protein
MKAVIDCWFLAFGTKIIAALELRAWLFLNSFAEVAHASCPDFRTYLDRIWSIY